MSEPEYPDYCNFECNGAGPCPIYKAPDGKPLYMRAWYVTLCCRDERWRKKWLAGNGPGQIVVDTSVRQSQSTAIPPPAPIRNAPTLAERLDDSIWAQFEIGAATVTKEEAEVRKQRCLKCPKRKLACDGECPEVQGTCGTRYHLWVQRIVAGSCERFTGD